MTEVARARGSSTEVERGEVPEVAELGNVLKGLFTRLGISQSQYAYRVHLDKSAVSRYLAGRRVAPQDFVDRLVREVEEHMGAPLRPEAKQALRDRRLEALRVCSPDEYRLESLRDELARSRRETERAHRNIEALHALLDKKEAEARDVADDLTSLRLDWGAERSALTRAQEDLRRQVEELREDLRDAEHLRAEAERHGEELRETVLRLEEELSRAAAGAGDLPLEAFTSRLLALWEEEDLPGAARELTEAAWSRPLEEAAELLGWLQEQAAAGTVEAFVVDVARTRPLEDVLAFAEEVVGVEPSRIRDAWATALATRVTDRNAAVVYQGLRSTQGDQVLGEALRRVASDADAVSLVLAALAGTPSPRRLVRVASALVRERGRDRKALRVLVRLAEAGRSDVAARLLAHFLQIHRFVRLAQKVRALDDPQIDTLFDLVTWLDDTELMTAFAMGLTLDRRLLDRLLTTMAAQNRLGLVDLTAFEELEQAVTRWRRSRGQ
ncbi:helix-turn-helix domain-containing protein [Streptomyces sp. NPDC055815]